MPPDQDEHHEPPGQPPVHAPAEAVRALLDALVDRGLAGHGWTGADSGEAGVLLHRHGLTRLLDAALAGTPPATLRGALTRWRALPEPRRTATARCPVHGTEHPAERRCPLCRAEDHRPATPAPTHLRAVLGLDRRPPGRRPAEPHADHDEARSA